MALLCSAFALSGCHVMHHKYEGSRVITPGTTLPQASTKIGEVDGRKKSFYLIFGLIPINGNSGPDYADKLAVDDYGSDYDGITHFEMSEEMDAIDVIVNIFVGIIFSMMTVEVEGDVHQYGGGGNS